MLVCQVITCCKVIEKRTYQHRVLQKTQACTESELAHCMSLAVQRMRPTAYVASYQSCSEVKYPILLPMAPGS